MVTVEKTASQQESIDTLNSNAKKSQEDFEKAKKRVKEDQEKAQAAKKRSDKLKKDFEKLKTSYRAGGVSGGIAAIVSRQVGAMRGKLTAYVQQQLFQALGKFTDSCPSTEELKRLIVLRNNLLKQINLIEGRVNSFKPIATNLTVTVTVLKAALQVIKQIPIPTAIIPPMSGGVGIPISVLNKFSDRISKVNTQVDKFSNEATAIKSTISRIAPVLANLKLNLQSLDIAIEGCILNKPSQELTDLIDTAQPLANTGSENTNNTDPNYEYRGYKLEIIKDPNSPEIAPRRYAIAKDKRGVIVLRGQPSFSSTTQVLLDEIKFRIDNNLP